MRTIAPIAGAQARLGEHTFAPTTTPDAKPVPDLTTPAGDTFTGPAPADVIKRAQANVEEVRAFFAKYGLGAEQGNGPMDVTFDLSLHNNAYQFRNTLTFGTNNSTHKWYSDSKDTVAHEYAHRVVTELMKGPAKLLPGFSRALGAERASVEESLPDVFAAAIDTDDWLLAEDVEPGGLFSMSNPGDPSTAGGPQVSHMRDKTKDFQTNHGIPNKAAYLIGEKVGRPAMADIYMNALRKHMGWSASFKSTANATLASAAELYGQGSTQAQAVRDAWTAVGVLEAAKA